MKPLIAHYRCLGCGHEWREEAGQWPKMRRGDDLWGVCRRCLSLDVKWLNYEKDSATC